MKIAIVTIATDKYCDNMDILKDSIDQYFCNFHEKKLFLYTDRNYTHVDVESFHICHLPSPLIQLLKFKYIVDSKDRFLNYDLIYFIDGDCKIESEIYDEIFPDRVGQIVATKHPYQHYNSNSYETNINSTACVIDSKNTHYYQSCFFGGYVNDVLTMLNCLCDNIKIDLKNNIIAKWWDESHFNKYLIGNPPKELDMGYAYPHPYVGIPPSICNKKILHYNYNSFH